MYYPSTLASLTAFGSAVALPHNGDLWLTARMLLDGAGALFGLYLLISVGLLLAGRRCASVLGAAGGAVIWMTAMAGLLVGDAYVVSTAAVAATGAQAAPGVAARSGLRPAAGPALVFRVDVSRYPQVGVVVTVPDSQERLISSEFVVVNADHSVSPNVRQLSANNVQLMLVPDTGLGSARG